MFAACRPLVADLFSACHARCCRLRDELMLGEKNSPKKFTTQVKEGFETGRSYSFLLPRKKSSRVVSRTRKEFNPNRPYFETWQE
jgi:hypothetical protein